ncbi:MAG: PH domain-containing protein [Rikenellaceae bacterium]
MNNNNLIGVYDMVTDRETYFWSFVHVLSILLLGYSLYVFYDGGYLSAWFVSFVVALIIFMALSIPRRVITNDLAISVESILDVSQIEICEIASINKVSPRKIRWVMPIFGSCGFFGYYGYFFDFRHFHKIRIYATEWRYLVEIVDIYEDYHYISCRERDLFIEDIKSRLEALDLVELDAASSDAAQG